VVTACIWKTPEEKWIASLRKSGTALLTAGCHAIDEMVIAVSGIVLVASTHTF
jgi:hypothetical protein